LAAFEKGTWGQVSYLPVPGFNELQASKQPATRVLQQAIIPNANGVGADPGEPLITRTPLALRLNVSHQVPPREIRMSHRIVSLLPAATEIVCSLGGEAWLVGRSHECDFPSSVLSLPICSRPCIDVSGSSRDINDRVMQMLRNGLSLFDVDVEQLKGLQPTLILTQAQCEVCAVSLADVEAALASRVGSRPHVVSLSPNCLNDVFDDIRCVAHALDIKERGGALVRELTDRLAQLAHGNSRVAAPRGARLPRPRVVCIEWLEPPMTAGNWVPELVAIAGGENLLSECGRHSPWLDWNDLVAANPDALILMPCGWSISRTRADLHWLSTRPEWPAIKAVHQGKVFLADGHHYFNRPGPRLIDSAEILAEILDPEHYNFGHRGTGWEPL
jgi:iron complex transport system substrate-binding protein